MRIITFLRKCAHIHLESILAHVNLLGLEDRLALDLSSSHEKNDADGDGGNASKDGSDDNSDSALVRLGRSIRTRRGSLVIGSSSIVPETTDLLTADSQVPVSGLKCRLHGMEVGRGGSDLHAFVDRRSGGGAGGVDAGKDGGSKYGTLGLLLLGSLELIDLVCVADGALDERHVHDVHNLILGDTSGGTVSDEQLVLSKSKQIKEVVIDLGGSSQRVAAGSTSGKIFASLVRKAVKELSVAVSIGTLHGSSVECNTLVPSCEHFETIINKYVRDVLENKGIKSNQIRASKWIQELYLP